MAMITAGNTAHFSVAYVSTLGSAGLAMAQAVLAACEEDFATLSYLFAVSPPAGTLPFQINIVYGFAIIAASRNPTTFVVPSDPDFTTVLSARRERRPIPARGTTGRARSVRCAEPAISHVVRDRCRHRDAAGGDTQ